MNTLQRFSILTFPQEFDGSELSLNIIFLPRNQNPLQPAIDPPLASSGEPARAFAEANMKFRACFFYGYQASPHLGAAAQPQNQAFADLATESPKNVVDIFNSLAVEFGMASAMKTLSNAKLHIELRKDQAAPDTRPVELTVRKYLPHSYRNSFNFTTPRHQNAVTDDSYRCAIRGARYVPDFEVSTDEVSWGQVFAFLLRQPLLAEGAGLLYKTKVSIDADRFKDGGWLFVDLAKNSDYVGECKVEPAFIRRYAARIPPLEKNVRRQIFAALQFPVLADATSSLDANYDQLFAEAAEYDDGFAKIVHCRQPLNRDLLLEENDGIHPVKDVGINLGWDDEQILIWYIRQMEAAPAGAESLCGRLDAPLGVFGYTLDVRKSAASGTENPWQSLNRVTSNSLSLPAPPGGRRPIKIGIFKGELAYQVYPIQVDGDKNKNFWLPMYYASWNGHSMILPDEDAASVYRTTSEDFVGDSHSEMGVRERAQNQLSDIYTSDGTDIDLRYGESYDFRVRLQDISGGGPNAEQISPETTSATATCHFRRYLSPNQVRILELLPTSSTTGRLVNSDAFETLPELKIKRPRLGYPAVVFTGKYKEPVQRLIAQGDAGLVPFDEDKAWENFEHREGLGIADPDVNQLEIVVEVAGLHLDKLASVSGRDDYVHLYTTKRDFPEVNPDNDDDYELALQLPIEYRDVKVLHSGSEVNLMEDFGLEDDIDTLSSLILPTGRKVRLTIRALCDLDDEENYFGCIDALDKRRDHRYGEPVQVMLYSPSLDETDLLTKTARVPELQGLYLQPDLVLSHDGRFFTALFGKKQSRQQSNMYLLAERLQVQSSGLTLCAKKGERIIFGCSSRICHTLSPDHSSLTFSSKGDLFNHWLCCLSFDLNRDWMWDGLEQRSFVIERSKWFGEKKSVMEQGVAGEIEVLRTASFEALHDPQRNRSRLIFIDAVEPKIPGGDGESETFPETISLQYTLEALFKKGHGIEKDEPKCCSVILPVTTPPTQTPKIVSAGIALSPYKRDETYSTSEVRARHLWIEFAEPVKDPQDCYFARPLAVAPDQLISSNDIDLLKAPEDKPLPIDPEYIRVITDDSANDLAGISAMQKMEKSRSSDTHYLLPLPPGLHANADEMFGFFTYEFRVGHYQKPQEDEEEGAEMVWCTAQGRYGRRLCVTGIQHPAPALTCSANRDVEKIWVTAPYAVAVYNGKNVTADPPRTQLWALLYAQVKQADNRDYRNILLDDRYLDWRIKIKPEGASVPLLEYTDEERMLLKSITSKIVKFELTGGLGIGGLQLKKKGLTRSVDATKYGTTVWLNSEVSQLLLRYGLPLDSRLSVVVVETLPQITNIFEHVPNLISKERNTAMLNLLATEDKDTVEGRAKEMGGTISEVSLERVASPVNEALGHHRFLRTSPLTKVPDICTYDMSSAG